MAGQAGLGILLHIDSRKMGSWENFLTRKTFYVCTKIKTNKIISTITNTIQPSCHSAYNGKQFEFHQFVESE